MIELSLKDRLQPALLDRLTDDERVVTVFHVTPDAEAIRKLGISFAEIERALATVGLRPAGSGASPASDQVRVRRDYVPAGAVPTLGTVRETLLRPSGGGNPPIRLQACCAVEATRSPNVQPESAERRAMSMRKLRDAVLRDLALLLNASGIDDVVDLDAYPEVRRSVLNYGLRSQAGRMVTSIDAATLARQLRDAIGWFEPRLTDVRVTPEGDGSAGMTMTFRVEAELWGQPVAQHLSLRTSIDVESGDVRVSDSASRS